MTLSEAFIFKAGDNMDLLEASSILEFANLDPIDTWDPEDKDQRCKFYESLLNHLNGNDVGIKSESEGGYSKTYDKEGKGKYLAFLADESGCEKLIEIYNPEPKVRDKSNYW